MTARTPTFAAIDFETANGYRNSACQLAVVRVTGDRIVRRAAHLIRPPFRAFTFTHIHGLSWQDVRDQPTFAEVWRCVLPLLRGVEFIAAHNAPFDRSVLRACCAWYGLPMVDAPFECTMMLARRAFGIRPTTLSNVAAHLQIPLQHHDARSDAEASARIVIAARQAAAA